jgi:hypothetical protein
MPRRQRLRKPRRLGARNREIAQSRQEPQGLPAEDPGEEGQSATRTAEDIEPITLEEILEQTKFDLAHERLLSKRAVENATSGDPSLRGMAAREVARVRHPVALAILLHLARDSAPEVRKQALESMLDRDDLAAFPLFAEALADEDVWVRLTAVRGIYNNTDEENSIALLIEALEDKAAAVRRRAATCLGWADATESVPNLAQLLYDPDPGVRKAAVGALGDLKRQGAIPSLIEALEDDDQGVREGARQALENLANATIRPAGGSLPSHRGSAKADWESWWAANRGKHRLE